MLVHYMYSSSQLSVPPSCPSLKPMGFGFRPPPVHGAGDGSPGGCAARSRVGVAEPEGVWRELCVCACEREVCLGCLCVLLLRVIVCLSSLCVGSGSRVCPQRG